MVRRRRSSWTIWNRRSARRIRLLWGSRPRLDETERMTFGILENPKDDIRQHGARHHHLAAERLGLLERRGDVGRLGIERPPRRRARVPLSDAADDPARIAGPGDAVVARRGDVERPPEQVAVELPEPAA